MKTIVKSLVIAGALFTFTNAFAANNDLAMQKNLLNMQNQISDMEEKLAAKDGEIDELNYKIRQLELENKELKEKLAATLSNQNPTDNNEQNPNQNSNLVANGESKDLGFENANGMGNSKATKSNASTDPNGKPLIGTVSVAPSKEQKTEGTTKDGELTKPDAEAQKLYNEAYALLNKGSLDKAAPLFSKYVQKYPNNMLTPNSWYWLGQIQYKQKNYQDARISFLNTAKFKNTAKRADALYKLGITSKALGDKAKAKRFFEVLIKTYPTSSSSALAKKELESLK